MRTLEALVAAAAVGSLLLTDLQRAPCACARRARQRRGRVRLRSQPPPAAVPAHEGVILRYTVESFVALGVLVVIQIVAEHLLPDEIFGIVLAGLIGFLLWSPSRSCLT